MGDTSRPSPPFKRPRISEADAFIRRKRAPTACQFCRLRKTRCDNVRPVCGVCRYHQATCKYADEEDGSAKYPTLDVLGEDIVLRLDEIRGLLQAGAGRQYDHHDGSPEAQRTISGDVHTSIESTSGDRRTPRRSERSALDVVFLHTRCETIFQWPMVQELLQLPVGRISWLLTDRLETSRLPADSLNGRRDHGTPQSMSYSSTVGVDEEKFVPLCQKFLKYVHARNPILDPEQLLRDAKELSDSGLRWDARSCLVLIACALASFTVPWSAFQTASSAPDKRISKEHITSSAEAQGRAYYAAAKRRIGLLSTALTDIQCFFFASMLEKYLLQPFEAWFHLQQACQRLQGLLRIQDRHEMPEIHLTSNPAHSSKHLEQRIFWSCYKSEQELVTELGLPTSGLADLDYPYPLPDPPDPSIASPATSYTSPPGTVVIGAESPEQTHRPSISEIESQKQSWSFYLTEIVIRRAMVQSLRPLYSVASYDWLKNVEHTLEEVDEAFDQTRNWYQCLPPNLRFHQHGSRSGYQGQDELAVYLKARFIEWQEACLRPAFYILLHTRQHSDTLSLPAFTRLQRNAQVCLDINADIIRLSSLAPRHGGTWLSARQVFRSAMLILVALKSTRLSSAGGPSNMHGGSPVPSASLTVPGDWSDLCSAVLRLLDQFRSEAGDLDTMHAIVVAGITAVQHRNGT